MTFGLRCSEPARRPHPASLPVCVPAVESLLRASFSFTSRLRLALRYGYRHRFRLAPFIQLDSAHAGHTPRRSPPVRLREYCKKAEEGGSRSPGGPPRGPPSPPLGVSPGRTPGGPPGLRPTAPSACLAMENLCGRRRAGPGGSRSCGSRRPLPPGLPQRIRCRPRPGRCMPR